MNLESLTPRFISNISWSGLAVVVHTCIKVVINSQSMEHVISELSTIKLLSLILKQNIGIITIHAARRNLAVLFNTVPSLCVRHVN